MTLPADVTTYTLRFRPYRDLEWQAVLAGITGRIRPVDGRTGLPVVLKHITTDTVVLPEPLTVTLTADGGEIVLPHNDAAALSPRGFAYAITWSRRARGVPRAGRFAVPVAYGTSAWYEDLRPAPTATPIVVPIAVGPPGPGLPPGGAAGQYLTKAGEADYSTTWQDVPSSAAALEAHVNHSTPHPVYDDMPSLTLIFENGLV